MRAKRLYYEKEETVVKKTTGYIEVDLDFIQVFRDILESVMHLNTLASTKILFYIMTQTTERTGLFSTTQNSYDDYSKWCIKRKFTPFSIITYRNSIKELFDCGIILKVSKGNYRMNPMYIWGDKIENRNNLVIDLAEQKKL
jgi:hypothetical protein